jgi:hypothetical protein
MSEILIIAAVVLVTALFVLLSAVSFINLPKTGIPPTRAQQRR